MIKRGIDGALLVGVLVTMGFMLYAGEPTHLDWWLGFLFFGLWAFIPYFVVASMARRVSMSQPSLWVLLVAALLLTAGSSIVLYMSFIAQPDPQSGVVFVFLPMSQLVALVPFLLVAFLLRRRDEQ